MTKQEREQVVEVLTLIRDCFVPAENGEREGGEPE